MRSLQVTFPQPGSDVFTLKINSLYFSSAKRKLVLVKISEPPKEIRLPVWRCSCLQTAEGYMHSCLHEGPASRVGVGVAFGMGFTSAPLTQVPFGL